jgi:hypothetical protein
MRRTIIPHARSIVGAALLLLGTFLCYAHLSHAAALWSHVFVGSPSGASGGFPDVILAAWRVYPIDQKRFLHIFLRHLLISSWPLLLVLAGTALSREPFFVQEASSLPEKKICGSVDLTARRSTSK